MTRNHDVAPWLTDRPVALTSAIAAIALVAIVGVAYHDAPMNAFHLDDIDNICTNDATRIERPTVESLWRAAVDSPLSGRPIPYVTFAVDWWRGNGTPRPFLWSNMAIHAVASLSVFGLLLVLVTTTDRRVTRAGVLPAFLGAALWAAHPIHVQAVTYIVQRMAQLACLFTVLAVLLFILARVTERGARRLALLIASGLCVIGAVLSKENAWVAPVLIYLAELGVVRNDRPLFINRMERTIVVAAVVAAALLFALTVAGVGPVFDRFAPTYKIRDFTMVERILTQPRVVLFHTSQLLLPLPGRFSIQHDFSVSTTLLTPFTTLLAVFVVLGWCAAGGWLLCKPGKRIFGFLMLWTPVALVVESSFIGLEMIFEHRMYLPTVGIVGLVALLMRRFLGGTTVLRTVASASAACIIIALVWSTASYVPVWRSQLSLARNSVVHAPTSARAWSQLGKEQLIAGSIDEAERSLSRALELDPADRWASEWMGIVQIDRGRLDRAEHHLMTALIQDPKHPDVNNYLGEVHFQRGRYEDAEGYFRFALSVRPWEPNYMWNLALALERLHRCDEALAEWRRYLELSVIEDGRERVRNHIQEAFLAESGACFTGDSPGTSR